MTGPSYSTIDRWLFDYMEGNLDDTQIQALELFVLENPELELDLDAWDNIHVLPAKDNEEIIASIIKNALKTESVFRIPYAEMMSVAALAIIFALSAVYTKTSNTTLLSKNPISSNKTLNIEEQNYPSSDNQAAERKDLMKDVRESKMYSDGFTAKGTRSFSGKKSFSNFTNPSEVSRTSDVVDRNVPSLIEDVKFADYKPSSADPLRIADRTFHETASIFEFGNKGLAPIMKSKQGNHLKINRVSKVKSNQLSMLQKMNYKAKQRMRAIKRMMDSPLALKNSRTPHLYLPGHTLQDINIGFTGATMSPTFTMQSRMQWMKYANNQISSSANFGAYFYGIRGGLGAQVKHTYYGNGLVKGSEVAITYSPKISLSSNMSIEPSVRFKMGNKNLNIGNQTFDQSIEVERGNSVQFLKAQQNPIGSSLWYKDIAVGTLLNSKWFYAGIQVDNVFKHYDDLFATQINNNKKADQHWIVTAGTDYENVRQTMRISPSLIYQKQGALSELWLGVNFQYYKFMVNSSVSNKLEPTLGIGVELKRCTMFYQADYLRSRANNNQALSHQFGIKLTGKKLKTGKL
jgi:hypothetical protein